MIRTLAGSFFVWMLTVLIAGAAVAELKLEDPVEPRVKTIAQQLRCPVCQGETVYDSHSAVATQLKDLIREQVSAGRSDDEILAFFVARYGDFVLMEPKARGANLLIWLFPAAALLLGSLLLLLLLHRRRASAAATTATVKDTEDLMRRVERLEL